MLHLSHETRAPVTVESATSDIYQRLRTKHSSLTKTPDKNARGYILFVVRKGSEERIPIGFTPTLNGNIRIQLGKEVGRHRNFFSASGVTSSP